MATAPEDNNSGSGDAGFKSPVMVPAPEPPKIPDVELIVDGFGFMPKEMRREKRRRSSVYAKTKQGPKEDLEDEGESTVEQSSCASSTNIDVVRRYTWKTKNRMLVQVD